jgi:hypothetical protein
MWRNFLKVPILGLKGVVCPFEAFTFSTAQEEGREL